MSLIRYYGIDLLGPDLGQICTMSQIYPWERRRPAGIGIPRDTAGRRGRQRSQGGGFVGLRSKISLVDRFLESVSMDSKSAKGRVTQDRLKLLL